MFTMFIGHKYLYERGVLHRDISPGNILIKWRPDSEMDKCSTSGCLIDLDHAKRGKLIQDEVKTPVDDTMIDRIQTAIRVITDVEVEKEVARLSLEVSQMNRTKATAYLYSALDHASNFRPLTEQLNTAEHLGWKQVRVLYFLFLSL